MSSFCRKPGTARRACRGYPRRAILDPTNAAGVEFLHNPKDVKDLSVGLRCPGRDIPPGMPTGPTALPDAQILDALAFSNKSKCPKIRKGGLFDPKAQSGLETSRAGPRSPTSTDIPPRSIQVATRGAGDSQIRSISWRQISVHRSNRSGWCSQVWVSLRMISRTVP